MARHARVTPAIYLTTLGLAVVALAALPLVHVDVSVQANGLLRTDVEKNEVKSMVAGIIERVPVQEGATVSNGQVLLTLADSVLEERQRLAQHQARVEWGQACTSDSAEKHILPPLCCVAAGVFQQNLQLTFR